MDGPTAVSLLELAERTATVLHGPDAKPALEEVDARYGELIAALDWFVDEARTDDALRLANALYPYWIAKQRFRDGADGFERAPGSPGPDDRLRAAGSINAGFMPFWMGDDESAASLFGQGLDISRRIEDPHLTSRALGGLARVALRSDVPRARILARQALDESEAADDLAGRSNALHLLGVGAHIAGDLVEARDWMRRRLVLAARDGSRRDGRSEASNLSIVERKLGNLDEAEALVREALEIAERRGDEFMKPFTLTGLAAIANARGDHRRAAMLLGAAEAMMDAHGAEWPPDERPQYEQLLAELPDAMGSAVFEHARLAGRSTPARDAVALALRTESASSAPA